MTRWYKQTETRARFLTGKVRRRIPLFKKFPEFTRLLLESLEHCRKKYSLDIYGFVIMPDHFHLLVGTSSSKGLSSFLRDWKGFVGHAIIADLRKKHRTELLKRFECKVRRPRDSRYQLFQPDTHVEGVYSKSFFDQKLNYIHRNPVVAGLAANILDYPYSSAKNYVLHDNSLFRIDRLEN